MSVDGPALLDRLVRRANPRDEWKIAHWQEFWPQARAQSCVWAGARHVNVDNTGDEPDLSVLNGCIGANAVHQTVIRPADGPAGAMRANHVG